MPESVRVFPLTLEPTAFQPYGVIAAPLHGQTADTSGEGWQCWYPLGELDENLAWQIGLVHSEARARIITSMERHLQRPEWVFALEQPLIQAVALSHPANPAQPDAASFKAFILYPGQGVLIEKGIWHAVGLPAGDTGIQYGFVLAKETPDTQENSGWVPFAGGQTVWIE